MGRPRKTAEVDEPKVVVSSPQGYGNRSIVFVSELLALVSQIVDAMYRSTGDFGTWKPLSDKVEEMRKKLMV